MHIVVIKSGFAFVCREFTETPESATLTTARCIRVWGTARGLGQLVSGPTKETVLDDTIPIISTPRAAVLFSFEVSSAWDKHL